MIQKLKVAILGSGNIGCDLLEKVRRSPLLECTIFIGRDPKSRGLAYAAKLGTAVSHEGIAAIEAHPECCDLVFDATTASQHLFHDGILAALGKTVIDMTPSRIGRMVVPAVNLGDVGSNRNINMVSCGGQASLPLACAVSSIHSDIEYIEVVSSIASLSAGPATRLNIDEYVETTEDALRQFTGCQQTKALLILNPAIPPIHMQTTISAKLSTPDWSRLRPKVDQTVAAIQKYVPGYSLIVPPVYEQNRLVISVRVAGRGDYLPPYAGNLDIINCAAVAAAENYTLLKQG